jgi:uncharacterized OsmC-like protein
MKISASVQNSSDSHRVRVKTNDITTVLNIEPRASGRGSSVNGGELLFLALASCYCNDIFREAAEMGIDVAKVDVIVEGEFGAKGEPASDVNYDVKISANASETEINKLLQHTDRVAEIQNTLRIEVPVKLRRIEIT